MFSTSWHKNVMLNCIYHYMLLTCADQTKTGENCDSGTHNINFITIHFTIRNTAKQSITAIDSTQIMLQP